MRFVNDHNVIDLFAESQRLYFRQRRAKLRVIIGCALMVGGIVLLVLAEVL
jgi:hypothetical protein